MGDDDDDSGHPCGGMKRDGAGNVPSAPAIACCCCGTFNGNVVTLCRRAPGARRWPSVCMTGPDWTCLCLTYALVVGCWVAFLAAVAPNLHDGVLGGGIVLMLLTLLALTLTACSDPGYVPKRSVQSVEAQRARWDAAMDRWRAGVAAGTGPKAEGAPDSVAVNAGGGVHPYAPPHSSLTAPYSGAYTPPSSLAPGYAGYGGEGDAPKDLRDENGKPVEDLSHVTLCSLCNIFRAKGTAHCYDCNSCVEQLDHHCPWTGKCVGKYNLMPFYAFLWAITGSLVYVIAALLTWLLGKVVTKAL